MKKNIKIYIILFSALFSFSFLNAQLWYRVEMVSVKGYNNNCDGVGNEEGEFEVRASDNANYAAWSSSGCLECDGNMNNGTGITCGKTNLVKQLSTTSTTINTIRTENRGQEDDGVSNCDWNDDCADAWGDQQNHSLTVGIQDVWQSVTRTRGARWQMTYRYKWTYAIPNTGNVAITTDAGIVTDFYGPDATDYANNMDGSLTIYPVTIGNRVQINFTQFGLENGFDYVDIYNGNTTGATLIGSYTGTTSPGTITSTACDGSLTVRFRSDGSVTDYVGAKFSISNVAVTGVAGTAGTYGTNQWYISTYRGNNFNWYAGYLTNSTSTEFNIGAIGMASAANPSVLAGYLGAIVCDDNWSIIARRQGFPCGVYNVIIQGHDDDILVNVDYDGNGTVDYTRSAGCCDLAVPYTVAANIVLNSNSKVEIQLREGGGAAYVDVDFTAVTPPALSAGAISGITNGITICTGGDPGSFSTSAAASGGVGTIYTGGSYSYQWESSTTSATTGFATISGATAQTYDPPAITATTWFRRKVTDACGNTATSGTIQVIVVADPTASTPTFTAATICAGGSTNVSVTAANGTGSYTYQWQYFNGSTWNNVVNGIPMGSTYTNPTSATMTIAGISAAAAYQYRCNVGTTGVGCDVISSAASTLTVVADPTIATQPTTTQTICIGATSNLTVAATGGTGTFSYQWYSNTTNSNSGGTSLGSGSGAQTDTYTPPSATAGTVYYYCVISQTGLGCGPINSNTATVIVVADPTISTQPTTTQTLCVGGSPTNLTVAATGGTGTFSYQWFSNTTNSNSGGTSLGSGSGAQTDTYTPPSAVAGTVYYYCVISQTGAGCGPINSNTAAVIILAAPTISAQPTPTQSLCVGGSPTNLTVAATGGIGTFSYQWFSNTTNSNSGGTSLGSGSGAQTDTYTPLSAVAGTVYYYCVVSQTGAGCGPISSNTATVTVRSTPTASISGTTIVCQNAATPTITFTNPQTLPITITYNINGASNTTINVGASTTATVTAATGTAGTFAYNLVSVAYQTAPICSNAISGSATLTVNPRPTATTCKVADPCQTSSGQITVNISGGTTPYTITYSPAGTPASPITTSAASAIITGLTGGQTYNFVVSDANNCTAP